MRTGKFLKQPEYFDLFLDEAHEHLADMDRHLALLAEDSSDRDSLAALFRAAHSIKGMAATLGLARLARLAHGLEDALDRFRRAATLPPEAVEQLSGGLELLEGLLGELAAGTGGRAPSPAASQSPVSATPGEVHGLAIDMPGASASAWLRLINELMRLGTLLACQPAPEQIAAGETPRRLEVRLRSGHDFDYIRRRCAGVHEAACCSLLNAPPRPEATGHRRAFAQRTVRVATDVLDGFVGLTGELITVRHRLREAFAHGTREQLQEGFMQFDRLLGELRHQVLGVRMMPLETVTACLPRLMRQLNRSTGKQARLQLSGMDVRLDRTILETLADPLVHLVRNAVDHGIEQAGTLTIAARRDKDRMVLEVADDGRGMDAAEVLRRARRDGLVTAEQAAAMSEAEQLQLICRPGFSTSAQVTETSGRGVGMDVVRHAVEKLGGSLEIVSRPGRGTRFRFVLPLTVAIVPALLVVSAGQVVGLPLVWVNRILEEPSRESRGGEGLVDLEERRLPVRSLARLLGQQQAPARGGRTVIVCESQGDEIGLAVDGLIGQQEVFARPLTFPFDGIAGLNAVTVLGDGRVVFLLDPHALPADGHALGEQP
jgi:two-component system chemotaxis sensor kinase CheA